jgi:hypothetical protein
MRPRGPLDAVTGVVGDAAAGLRRRREARRPNVKLYDESGGVRVLDPDDERTVAMLETAAAMVDAAVPASRAGRAEGA